MRNRWFSVANAALLLSAGPASVLAQCSDWRARPVIRGMGEIYDATVWDADGDGPQPPLLVVGGNFDHAGEASTPIARNIAALDGTAWRPLGAGLSNGQNVAYVSAVTSYDGDLIAGGFFLESAQQPLASIARWDGTAWLPLGSGIGGSLPSVKALTVFNGELIAAGDFSSAGDTPCTNIARWNGSAWQPLGAGLAGGAVYALTVHDGALIAGGYFDSAGGAPANHVARWNGSAWEPLGDGIQTPVAVLSTYAGELIAGRFGHFGNDPRDTVLRWDGQDWQPLGTGVGNAPMAGAMSMTQYAGELIVGGYYTTADGAAGNYISSWDGSAWRALGTGVDSGVEMLAVYNGLLFAGGNFENAGNVRVEGIARWNGTNWLDLSGLSRDPGGTVMALTPWAGGMVLGGQFMISADGVPYQSIDNLAFFDGTRITALAGEDLSAPSSWVTALTTAPRPDGSTDLIIGGYFDSIAGTFASNVALLNDRDGAGWQPLGAGLGEGFLDTVWALTWFNGSIFAGGQFDHSGGAPLNRIARWDGAAWRPVGPGPVTGVNGEVYVLKGLAAGPSTVSLAVGGSFSSAGGVPANHIALYTESTISGDSSWSALGAGFNGRVFALEYFDGSLYAAGEFTASGSTPLNHIARWDGAAWVALGAGTDGPIKSLTVSNGTLVAGGDFDNAGGVAARHLARWNGAAWSSLGGHTDGPVHALATLHDEIHLGGAFMNVRNGVLRSPIWARYSEHGLLWIAEQPQSAERPCRANFAPDVAVAQGYGGLSYQWRKNGVPLVDGPTGTGSIIVGANGNFGVINVSRADEGEYDCVITNGCGTAVSEPATLTVDGPCLRGDTNCDGAINNFDIDAFVLALTGPAAYSAAYPHCDIRNADANLDGAVNNFDIDAFVALLAGS